MGPGGRVTPGGSVDKKGASIDTKGASVDKPGGAKGAAAAGGSKLKKPITPEQRHQLMIVGIAAVVVLGVGYAIYAYFDYSRSKDAPPRLDAPGLTIAQYVSTPKFDQLPFNRQWLYMKELAGKRKDLEADYKAGKMTKEQLEDALAVGWLGNQLKHIDEYYSLGEIDRKNKLDKLLDKQLVDNTQKDEVSKDKAKVKSLVERFPDQHRRDYEAFRKALKEREKQRTQEAKAAAKAAKATSRPTTRQADRPDPKAVPAATTTPHKNP
jgi:hypothetical protein